ncbi:MAG: mechanosensitive ion channel [Methylococcales bacterium]|nr:mechanosensitive ion channel [Methylococcales bacterium]
MTMRHSRRAQYRQPTLWHGLVMFGVLLVLGLSSRPVLADTDMARLEARLTALSEAGDSPQNQQLREIWLQSRQLLVDTRQFNAQAERYTNELQRYPEQLAKLEKQYQAPARLTERKLNSLSLERLEQLQVMLKVALLEMNSERKRHEVDIESLRKRTVGVRAELAEVNTALNELNNHPQALSVVEARLQEALKNQADFHRQMLIAKIRMLELESLLIPKRLELAAQAVLLLSPGIDQAQRDLDQLTAKIEQIKAKRPKLRVDQSLQQVIEHNWRHPVLRQLAQENQQLARQLTLHTELGQAVTLAHQRLALKVERLDKGKSALQRRLNLQGRDDFLGAEIRRQLRHLPARIAYQATEQQLNQARLLQFALEEEKQELADSQTYLKQRLAGQAIEETDEDEPVEVSLSLLIKARLQLVEQTLPVVYGHIKELESYLLLLHQFNERRAQFDTLLRENLLLTLSAKPLSGTFFADFQQALRTAMPRLQEVEFERLLSAAGYRLAPVLLLCAGFFYYWRRYYPAWRQDVQQAVGKMQQDRIRYPLLMVLAALVKAAVASLPIATLAFLWREQEATALMTALDFMLHVLARGAFLWVLMLELLSPQGLVAGQFKCPDALLGLLYRGLRRLGPALLTLSGVIAFTDAWPDELLGNTLGRSAFLLSCVLIAAFAWQWLKGNAELAGVCQTHRLRWLKHPGVWAAVVFLEQLYMLIMAAQGYYFAAIFQKVLVIQSVFWVMVCVLGFYLAHRGLLITQRRLAYQQAMARRNELRQARASAAASSISEVDAIDDYQTDIKTISQQSATLLRIIAWFAVLLGLGMIWMDVLPALSFLDRIVLWGSSMATETGVESRLITLRTALLTLLVMLVVVAATHNLPGALELLVLRHLELNTGTSYAITSLLKYSIMIVGLGFSFQQLGLEWAKLQWLLAALSVGLGFGLQEIVANFVSGLIILFERPIRIGDVITLGNIDGIVSRIHIRATTLIDFNRKEVLVPNKTFITEQLTNWSLNDQVTRLQIPVGIAYGSDCQKALTLLTEIARVHPKVMPDPEPYALFMAFGDSALNLELRVYVDDIDSRLGVLNDLHLAINESFLQAGIVIAFPQLDVHLHSGEQRQNG